MNRPDIYTLIDAERARQREKWSRDHEWGWGDCSSPRVRDDTRSMVLSEECGEVARAVLDKNDENLRVELVQVAAVAIAWLEYLTRDES